MVGMGLLCESPAKLAEDSDSPVDVDSVESSLRERMGFADTANGSSALCAVTSVLLPKELVDVSGTEETQPIRRELEVVYTMVTTKYYLGQRRRDRSFFEDRFAYVVQWCGGSNLGQTGDEEKAKPALRILAANRSTCQLGSRQRPRQLGSQ